MLHERRAASFAESGDHIDHALRQADIVETLGEFERGERRLLGGLQHAGASGGERGSELPCAHQQWIIPRDYLSRDSDGLFQRQAHRIVWHGIYVADNFRRQATIVFKAGCDIVDVKFGFDNGLASISAFQLGEQRGILADFFRQAKENSPAFLRGRRRPRTFVKRGSGRCNCAVHVFSIGVGDLPDHFLGRRIVDGKRLVRSCSTPIRR